PLAIPHSLSAACLPQSPPGPSPPRPEHTGLPSAPSPTPRARSGVHESSPGHPPAPRTPGSHPCPISLGLPSGKLGLRTLPLRIADCGLRIADLKQSHLSTPNPLLAPNPQSAIRNPRVPMGRTAPPSAPASRYSLALLPLLRYTAPRQLPQAPDCRSRPTHS